MHTIERHVMHLTRPGSLTSSAPSHPSPVRVGSAAADPMNPLTAPVPGPLSPLSPLSPLGRTSRRSIDPSQAGSGHPAPCCAAALHPGAGAARSLEQALSQALSLARASDREAPGLLLDLRPFPASSVRDIPSDIWQRLADQVRAVQMPSGWTSRDIDWLSTLREVDMIECMDLPAERHPFHALPRAINVVITPEPHPDWRCAEHRHRLFLSTAEAGRHAYLNAFSSQHADAAVWTLRLAADRPQDHWPSAEHYVQAAEAAQQLTARARAHMPHDGQDQRGWLIAADQAKLIGAVIQQSPVTLLSTQGRTAMLALQHQARGPEPLAVLTSWQLHVMNVATRAAVDALLQPDVSPPTFKPASSLMALAQMRYLEAEALQPQGVRRGTGTGTGTGTGNGPRHSARTLSRTLSAPAPAAAAPRIGLYTPPRWSTGPLHFHSSLPQVQQNLSMAEAFLPAPRPRHAGVRPAQPTGPAAAPPALRPRREHWLAQVVQHLRPGLPRQASRPSLVSAESTVTPPAARRGLPPSGSQTSRTLNGSPGAALAPARLDLARATPSPHPIPSTGSAQAPSAPRVPLGTTPAHRHLVAPPPSDPPDEVDGTMGECDAEHSETDATPTTSKTSEPAQALTQRSRQATDMATHSLDRRRSPASPTSPTSPTSPRLEPTARHRLGSTSSFLASTAARGPHARPASIAGSASAGESSREPLRTRKPAPLLRAESDIEERARRQPLLSRLRKLLSPPRRTLDLNEERFPALPPLPPAAPLTPWRSDRVGKRRDTDDASESVV